MLARAVRVLSVVAFLTGSNAAPVARSTGADAAVPGGGTEPQADLPAHVEPEHVSRAALAALDHEHQIIERCEDQIDSCESDADCAHAHLELSAGFMNARLREGAVPEEMQRVMLTHVGESSEVGAMLVLCLVDMTVEEAQQLAADAGYTADEDGIVSGPQSRRHLNFIFAAIIGGISAAVGAASAAGSAAVAAAVSTMAGFTAAGAASAALAAANGIAFVTTGGTGLAITSVAAAGGNLFTAAAMTFSAAYTPMGVVGLGLSVATAVYETVDNILDLANSGGDDNGQFKGVNNFGAPPANPSNSFLMIMTTSGVCLDGDGGNDVHTWDCDLNNKNQQWTFSDVTGQFMDANKNECMEAMSGGFVAGAKANMRRCDPENVMQKWQYTPSTGELKLQAWLFPVLMRSTFPMLCLDADKPDKKNSNVRMHPCDSNDLGQNWRIGTPAGSARARRAVAPPLPTAAPCWLSGSLDNCTD